MLLSLRMQCIYEVVVGNVIGVVEEPATIDQQRPLGEQYVVKIGVVDRGLPLDRRDAEQVITQLRHFATTLFQVED